jgi:hypothetical protein
MPVSNSEDQLKTPRYQRQKKCPLSDVETPKTSGKKKRPISLIERRPVSVYTAVQTPSIKNLQIIQHEKHTVYSMPINSIQTRRRTDAHCAH